MWIEINLYLWGEKWGQWFIMTVNIQTNYNRSLIGSVKLMIKHEFKTDYQQIYTEDEILVSLHFEMYLHVGGMNLELQCHSNTKTKTAVV